MSALIPRPALLIALLVLATSSYAAPPDIGTILPADEGWQSLATGPDWALSRAPIRRSAKAAPAPVAPPSPAPTSPAADGDGPVGEVVGAASTGGYVGLAGEPLRAPEAGPGVPDIPGVRYRVLSAGDSARPAAGEGVDSGHAWLRLAARRLDGIAVGPQRMADDTGPAMKVQRVPWSELPAGLGAAIKRMPYHARWEIYVEHPLAQGRHGLFSVSRARPTIFDVERLPPGPTD